MKNEVKIFKNPQFGEVRVTESENGEPLFCLSDVCRYLDLGNPSQVKTRLSADVISNEVGVEIITGKKQDGTPAIQKVNMTFVNEDGLYDVILDSRKPEAKAFRKWITSEILPSIRKHGGYMLSIPEETPEQLIARALRVAQEALERTQEQLKSAEIIINHQSPKVLFADAVSTSDRCVLVSELAKILKQNGIEIGQNRLFEWLRKTGYLCSKGEYYNQPSQKAMELGLFEIKKTSITKPDGCVLVTATTKVTGKGQIYFVNKFLNKAI